MADIVVTSAAVGVAVVNPENAEILHVVANADAEITMGDALYQDTSGTYGLADANAAGKQQFRGIALQSVAAGMALNMLKQGILSGYTLATYDDEIYLSDTAGALSTTPGTLLVKCGKVMGLSDPDLTEVAYIRANWLVEWGNAGEVP